MKRVILTLALVTVDECECVHVVWQDVTVAGYYNLLRTRRTSITRGVSFDTPTHAYQYSAEAAAGFGLKELGFRLTPVSISTG